MGSRAKRRLVWLGVVVAAGGVGAASHFVASAGSRGSDSPASEPRIEVGEQSGGVAYGDTTGQVLKEVGSPTKNDGTCWTYSANAHTINGDYLGKFVDARRYCFGHGPTGGKAVTAIEVHIVPHTLPSGKWYPGGWNHATVRMYPQQPPP